jgi:hypothetical protein
MVKEASPEKVVQEIRRKTRRRFLHDPSSSETFDNTFSLRS